MFSLKGSIGVITGFFMNGVLECQEDDCPSLLTMTMTRNGTLSTFVLASFVSLWIFMLVTSLHVFCIAVKTKRNNAVAPAGQAVEMQEELHIKESVQKIKAYVGMKKKTAMVI